MTAMLDFQWLAVAPELILIVTVSLVLLLDSWWPACPYVAGPVSLCGLTTALAAAVFSLPDLMAVMPWHGTGLRMSAATGLIAKITADDLSHFFTILLLSVGIMVTLIMLCETRENQDGAGAFALVLLANIGALVMAKGVDLLVIFLGWLTAHSAVSLAIGSRRNSARSGTAPALTHFLISVLVAGFFLYGIAFIYGATGFTSIAEISLELEKVDLIRNPYVLMGRALLLAGLGFSLALVPFHFWVSDVYDAAPTAITAFLAVAVKIAALAGFLRIFCGFGVGIDENGIFWILAVLTMTVGNLAALAQTSVRRLLAFSAIGHTGYMMVGIVAGGVPGWSAVLFYLITYAFTYLGAFGLVALCSWRSRISDDRILYTGLGLRYPLLGLMMALFMLSLAGLPPLGGFMGKLVVLRAAMNGGYVWLVVIALANNLVSLYYCLRLIAVLYRSGSDSDTIVQHSAPAASVVGMMAAGTIHSGICSAGYITWACAAVERLF
ncbi:MAG TPA: NADH-quinone oxidoreductase subunit N [Thermodesulfobacteriota bacterium]|nr:NADH-quinone oxidoreductase subunit N [Thermodesulfobacteriota bacterium]